MKKTLLKAIEDLAKEKNLKINYSPSVIAMKPEIKIALAKGYSLKTIWEAAFKNDLFGGCYGTFRLSWKKIEEMFTDPAQTQMPAIFEIQTIEQQGENQTAKNPKITLFDNNKRLMPPSSLPNGKDPIIVNTDDSGVFKHLNWEATGKK